MNPPTDTAPDTSAALPRWSLLVPPLALVLLVVSWGRDLNPVLLILVCAALGGAVVAAVHHAEVVAHRVGEPFGTLILAIAVTVIEVALIVTLMSSGGPDSSTLARDTVFAAIMITCNGIVGLALLAGALRHRVQEFRAHASGGALAVTLALVTLSLVLPAFTTSSAGPTFTGPQLAFAGVASLTMYGVFVFVQTKRHRDYFLPKTDSTPDEHAPAPSARTAWVSLGLLAVCLVSVVGLAKAVSPALEAAVDGLGAPRTVVGLLIALLVLLPETVAAVRAALRDRLQVSLNLALGSALASIGLTIPAIAVASIWLTGPLVLGLGAKEMVLLALTGVVGTLTLVSGRATVLQGAVHLMVFSAFLFLAVTP
ncbi:ionic transporter y4hA [Crossiella sp. SN42]|uniref:calcium:proton antiporter n=1 Tax=Crossiella sp. SN42 TaxID=2944808 RepID=UPI00207C5771|nr:ionic transporter y4hA [Crossiella sp. SN42]MCO1577596.1 ionic transporter y4hA [Crossiella sp. SN42]